MNIDNVVFLEKVPTSYCRVEPFTITIHHSELSIAEIAKIKDAIVNAAHEIRRLRGDDNEVFYWKGKS